jgi:hypothetical protein
VKPQQEVQGEILRNVRVMLRWAMLDDVEVVTRFGSNPRILQVRKGGEVIFTATVRGREAALPRPRQVPLPGTEDVVARPRFTPEEARRPRARPTRRRPPSPRWGSSRPRSWGHSTTRAGPSPTRSGDVSAARCAARW